MWKKLILTNFAYFLPHHRECLTLVSLNTAVHHHQLHIMVAMDHLMDSKSLMPNKWQMKESMINSYSHLSIPLFNSCFFILSCSHIAEHVGAPVDTSRMSEQELQFHYFKMHDADNNNKLDGCELVKSLIHWHGNNIIVFSFPNVCNLSIICYFRSS